MTDRPAEADQEKWRGRDEQRQRHAQRVGVSQVAIPIPSEPGERTGSFYERLEEVHGRRGTSETPLLRPSSSARPLVWSARTAGRR